MSSRVALATDDGLPDSRALLQSIDTPLDGAVRVPE